MRIAYCVPPRIGGTFNFYRNLYDAMRPFGHEVISVSVGAEMNVWQADDPFVYGTCVKVAADVEDTPEAGRAFVRWLADQSVDVMVPMYSVVAQAAGPFLPAQTRLVYACSSITRWAYRVVLFHEAYASAIACCSQRQVDDLRTRHGVSPEKLVLIPHGVDTAAITAAKDPNPSGRLRLAVIGRIEHEAKGVLDVPRIIDRLNLPPQRWSLAIIGQGPDEPALRQRLGRWVEAGNVQFHGQVPNAAVPELLREVDVLLMPSHFEGFGYAVIEAMAAGCVPVVSKLSGVTDTIVTEGQTGLLCPVGDAGAFAAAIASLADDPQRLQRMAVAARGQAEARYDLARFGQAWRQLLESVCQAPTPGRRRTDLDALSDVVGAGNIWRFLPERWKGRVRGLMERWRAS